MSIRTRRIVIALVAMTAGAALGASVSPTMSEWLDKGGSAMSVTSIDQAPPETVEPVYPGPGTIFVAPPVWSGPNYVGNPEPTIVCFSVEIRTTSETPVAWTVVIETDQPPFNNVPPFEKFQGDLFAGDGTYTFAPAADYTTTGRYLMTPDFDFQYASSTLSYLAKACAVNVPEPAWQPPGPDTYTQRPALEFVREGSMPCVAGTVDGHAPFHVGFTLAFNWKTLLDELLATGTISQAEHDLWITYNHWAGGPQGYAASQGATGADYLVTLQGYNAASRNVASFTPVTIASCAF